MKEIRRCKIVKILHKMNKIFITIFSIFISVLLGMALIGFNSLINFINEVECFYKNNSSIVNVTCLILVVIVFLSFILEKSLKSYFHDYN